MICLIDTKYELTKFLLKTKGQVGLEKFEQVVMKLRIQVGTVPEDGRTGESWNRIYHNPGGSNTQKDRSKQQGKLQFKYVVSLFKS